METQKKIAVKIENLTKVFNKNSEGEVVALHDVSLDIEEGKIFGIIGLSGAGKSTLVRCINFLEQADSGDVLYYDRKLKDLPKKQLFAVRKEIAMIFQNFNLFDQKTVYDNIALGLKLMRVPDENRKFSKTEIQQRVFELLELVGLVEKAKAYPSQLSGGQKQRVAIARALATNPKVLLCDEATSALDNATTETVLELLKDINRKFGVTIIVITHEMKVVEKICDSVAVIEDSKIVEVGSVTEVFTNPKSRTAKQLVIPRKTHAETADGKSLRLLFDGETLQKPIISAMAIDLNVFVNITFADTKTIEGKTFGQLVIQIPKDEKVEKMIKAYLKNLNINYLEEEQNV